MLIVVAGAAVLLLAGVALATVTVAASHPVAATARRSPFGRVARTLEPTRGLGVRAATNSVGADPEAIGRSLDRPEVARWGIANLSSVTIDGTTIPGVASQEHFASMPVKVVAGRSPVGSNEIALGSQTASKLGLEIGDHVWVTSAGERDATVTGTVVLPPVGQYESDRAGTGTGALLSAPFFRGLVAETERANDLPPGTLAETGLGAFVAIDLADGVDAETFFSGIEDQLPSWDRSGFISPTYSQPVRSAVIADVEDLRRLPLVLGAFFAATMAVGFAIMIAVATRARRRELAILRALGCAPRRLAMSVRWHALVVVAIALLVGVPVGLVAGRALYRAFAHDLGLVPDVELPVGWLVAIVVGAIGIALLAALGPARAAARRSSTDLLRAE